MFILLEDSIKRSKNFDEIVDKDLKYLLRKTCRYSELFWSVFSRIRTKCREILSISPYSVWIWENGDQNKSEYGHFLHSDFYLQNCGEFDDLEEILIEIKNFQIKNSTTKTKRVTQQTIVFSRHIWWTFPLVISRLAHLLPMVLYKLCIH